MRHRPHTEPTPAQPRLRVSGVLLGATAGLALLLSPPATASTTAGASSVAVQAAQIAPTVTVAQNRGRGSRGGARGARGSRGSGQRHIGNRGGRHGGSYGRGDGHRYGRSHRSYRYYGPSRYRSYLYGFNYGYGYGYPYGYGSYGYAPYGYGYGYDAYQADAGALDLDIKPEEAQIYVDGELVGIADNFDGFPRYLWLREGTRNVVIFKEGYETLARKVRVRTGEVIKFSDRMQEGASKTPDELFAQLQPTRERAVVRDRDLGTDRDRDRYDRPERERAPARRPVPRVESRDRAIESDRAIELDHRSEPARLSFDVTPEDAVVYLDGRLLGSAAELAKLRSDLLVDPGLHSIQVTRPGYRTWEREIEVEESEQLVIEAELESDR